MTVPRDDSNKDGFELPRDEWVKRLEELARGLNVGHLAILAQFGDMPHELAMTNIRRIGTDGHCTAAGTPVCCWSAEAVCGWSTARCGV